MSDRKLVQRWRKLSVTRTSFWRINQIFLRGIVSQGLDLAANVIETGYANAENWLLDGKKAQFGLAVTRMVLGVSGLGLLLANFSTRLYTFGSGAAWNGEAEKAQSSLEQVWIFSLFHRIMLDSTLLTLFYLILMVLAVLLIVGWRCKLVLPLYLILWISFIENNNAVHDQGDNMYRIALFLLLFADPARRLSFDSRRRNRWAGRLAGKNWLLRRWRGAPMFGESVGSLFQNLALIALAAQVFFVYTSGGLYKASGKAWSQGWAIYDPLMTDRFGPWPWLSSLVTHFGLVVAIISWSSIILQITFPLLLLRRPTRILALLGIMSFHVGIAVLMGLPFFSLTMIAIDFVFIRDVTWRRLGLFFSRSYLSAKRAVSSDAVSSVDAASAVQD